MSDWKVYMILCSDGSLYTGIAIDVERRRCQHAAQRGARYFRGRRPERVVYIEPGHTRSSASRREVAIKALRRTDKERLIASPLNQARAPAYEPAGPAPRKQ
jgi:putative endonuclease